MTAHEILSILKKPIISEGAGTVRDSTRADDFQLLQSSSLVCSDIRSQTEDHMQYLNVRDRNISGLKVTDEFHLDGISQPSDCTGQRASRTQSLDLSTGVGATDICLHDVEYIVTERRSPTAKHLASPESDSKVQAVEILCHNKFNKISEIENGSESVSEQDNPSGPVHALPDAFTLTHASNKPSVDNNQMDTQRQEVFSSSIKDASNDSAPQFPCHLTEMNPDHDTSTFKMDEFPSFDLGF